MTTHRFDKPKSRVNARNRRVRQDAGARMTPDGKRGARVTHQPPFVPPEDWYDPSLAEAGYRIVEQEPGPDHVHVVTAADVQERLSLLPEHFLEPLGVVQLSRVTRKKLTYPCYGMQWGAAIYLYPIDATLVERYTSPPRPNLVIETRMYGGRWEEISGSCWNLIWTENSIRDYYLNNVLIHELGHLLDDRNTSYIDRERYAEWFALEFGYKASRRDLAQKAKKRIRRRHHAS